LFLRRQKGKPIKLLNPKAAASSGYPSSINSPPGTDEQAYCAKYLKLADTALQMPVRRELKKAS
jgi:hypothetical protein